MLQPQFAGADLLPWGPWPRGVSAPSQKRWSSLSELAKKPDFLSPGIKWTPDESGVITFDCRNRGW